MESPKIITIYETTDIEIKWCSVTGKIKTDPGSDWTYPEGVDERVELCLSLCRHLSTDQLKDLNRKQYRLDPAPKA